LPLIYRLCAVWGAHEGSVLLWVVILNLWMAAVSIFSRRLPPEILARTLAVLSWVAVGFYGFILLTSNPFLRSFPNVPLDGQDLNPILQDPGMIIHPPILYMGYVGFSVVFAFSIAALLSRRLDAIWARWTRPWTLVAWAFLTYGIALGSWWAYRELGWGGWWFWDPVENASFLPWLTGTALLHSLSVTEKRGAFKAWTVLLAVCAFSLSLLGTFLVRSGVLISVHAFAVDPWRGQFILAFLTLVIGGSLLLYALRAKTLVSNHRYAALSRENILLVNNLFLTVAMLTVLLGTLYPLIIQSLTGDKLSVGAPYFNTIFVPLMLPFLFLLGLGPYFKWQATSLSPLLKKACLRLTLALLLAVALPWLGGFPLKPMMVIGLLLAFWILLQTLSLWLSWPTLWPVRFRLLPRSTWAMILAHAGVAVTLIGVTMVTTQSVELNLSMQPHEQVSLAGYQVEFGGVKTLLGPNYHGAKSNFLVQKGRHFLRVMQPEQRVFNASKIAVAKTAIDRNWARDIYIALGQPLQGDAWSVRIYYKPFVHWIWLGGVLMAIAGILGALDKRYRVKAR
jgi:cytochrome c-type biogenesis protein CcmF